MLVHGRIATGKLLDEVGENESHPLASLMEIVGVLIEKYEDEYVPDWRLNSSLKLCGTLVETVCEAA